MSARDMDSTSRESNTPFLLKVFYRTGTFHRPDELASTTSLPAHLQIHTYMNCTLLELAHHIASSHPAALPTPAIGTRLAFRLIYPDAAAQPSRPPGDHSFPLLPPRYLAKDLGSLVIGEGGPGIIDTSDSADADDNDGSNNNSTTDMTASGGAEETSSPSPSAATKTLADAKFVIGDYLSVAVLPPSESTGAVAAAADAAAAAARGETGRLLAGRKGGAASVIGGVAAPPARRDNGFPVGPPRGGRSRGARGGWGGREREWDGRGRDGYGARERDLGHGFPEGEWRRGERLPDAMPSRAGRRGSRW